MGEFSSSSEKEVPTIDLKSSAASKFLMHFNMPHEIDQFPPLSPLVRAAVAVPFEWEEAPGKPKIQFSYSGLVAQRLIPLLRLPDDRHNQSAGIVGCSKSTSSESPVRIEQEHENIVAMNHAGELIYTLKNENNHKKRRKNRGFRIKLRKPSRFFGAFFKSIWRSLLKATSRSSFNNGMRVKYLTRN